jgi:hypothetical protein
MKEHAALRKAQALLAKAADPATTPAEAEALDAKATEIMTKYGIDRAVAEARSAQKITVINRMILIDGPYAKQKWYLLDIVARHFDCKTIRVRTRNGFDRRTASIRIFGYERDLDLTSVLYTSLLHQVVHQMLQASASSRSARISFFAGFSQAVFQRLKEIREKAASGSGVQLVLYDRSKAVEQALRDMYSKTTLDHRSTISDPISFKNGQKAGEKANLHHQPETGAHFHQPIS